MAQTVSFAKVGVAFSIILLEVTPHTSDQVSQVTLSRSLSLSKSLTHSLTAGKQAKFQGKQPHDWRIASIHAELQGERRGAGPPPW